MQKLEFVVNSDKKLVKAIIDELPFLSRYDLEKVLDNKDVKVNGARVKAECEVFAGDKIVVYYTPKQDREWFAPVYEDENVLIVNKRAGIEVVSEDERDLLSVLKQNHGEIYAVHRLDRNTEGLTIFALNLKAKDTLDAAFKNRNEITKKYALLVHGKVDVSKIKRTVYLKKVENLSKVWISELKTSGYDPIITEFTPIEYRGENTLLEANLITGKTHQIRAHIAYYGHPILGDNKYGKDNEKTLHLTANYLAFNFKKPSLLNYLNQKTFEIIPSWL